jgi:sialate O-acetylesterase
VRYGNDIDNANFPQIRQFWVPNVTNLQQPQEDFPTSYWKSANPQDVLEFSVVAYYFAKKIYEKYHIPIGIINATVGGPPIESWTSEEGLKDFPDVIATIQKNKDTAYVNELFRKARDNASNRPVLIDKGLLGPKPWYDPTYIPIGWHEINVPGYWEDQGLKDLNGIVWYRKEINVPASMIGKPAMVFLGRVVDVDFAWINGKQIGNTTYQYPQRRYYVPSDLLKAGKNVIVIKVVNTAAKGGFVPDKPYCLFAGNDTVDLKGTWQYKVADVFQPQQRMAGTNFDPQYQPAALYNAMIAPITNYSLKGFLWYQGEGNTARPAEYAKLQPAMIADWRRLWQQGDLPFLYVQLPNFGDYNYLPSDGNWAQLRESQLKSLSVPNTAMAVTLDVGEWNDLHPDRKKEIGERLALAAENLAYGDKDVVYSGPIFQSATIDGNKITISFTHIGSGLTTTDGEELGEFAIAGADKKFVWAKAKIEGDKVIVWNENISEPKYVRYAWADNPVNPNLCNKEGLLASPFGTDQ